LQDERVQTSLIETWNESEQEAMWRFAWIAVFVDVGDGAFAEPLGF